jgi:subtilisin family serine protease
VVGGAQQLPAAWDVSTGAGATVAVIDTGAETSHPELVDRVLGAVSFAADGSPATTDSVGHGTHVASLACGAGNNGVGLAGAGLRCRMLILKSDFSDSSVANAIVYAVDHGADAINMSFGTDPGVAPSQVVRDAVDYAFARNVVMAAAAADTPIAHQGYPADLLQPTGTGPDLAVGKGLSVTAADASDARASFAGQAARSRSPLTAPMTRARAPAGRRGSSAPSPRGPTSSRPGRSGCRPTRRAPVAPPSPATRATPTCRGRRWRPRWSRRPAP